MFSCAFYFISLYPKHLKLNTLMLWRKMTVKSCKRIVYRYRPHASLDGHRRFTSESANMQAKLSLCYGKARRHFYAFAQMYVNGSAQMLQRGWNVFFSCINNRQISYDCLQVFLLGCTDLVLIQQFELHCLTESAVKRSYFLYIEIALKQFLLSYLLCPNVIFLSYQMELHFQQIIFANFSLKICTLWINLVPKNFQQFQLSSPKYCANNLTSKRHNCNGMCPLNARLL